MKKNKFSGGKEVSNLFRFSWTRKRSISLSLQYEKKILGSRVGNGRANNIFYAQIDQLDTDHGRCLSQFSMFADRR